MKRPLYQLSYSGKKEMQARGSAAKPSPLQGCTTLCGCFRITPRSGKRFVMNPARICLSSSSQYRGCVLDFRPLSWCSRKYSASLSAFTMKAASSDAASLMPHRPAFVVPRAGVEPAASEGQRLLRPPRLPISPPGLISNQSIQPPHQDIQF
jgi:hypothetical protein